MLCKCGHWKAEHIYEEGACRPGHPCPSGCKHFVEASVQPKVVTSMDGIPWASMTDGEATIDVKAAPGFGANVLAFCTSDGGGFTGTLVTVEDWRKFRDALDAKLMELGV
jgi:hypothetical protein